MNLFGAELLWGRKILSVIVSQMIVTDNWNRFKTGTDQEVDQHRLELSLTRLEIVTTNKYIGLFGHFNTTGDKSVLGRSIDKCTLETRQEKCQTLCQNKFKNKKHPTQSKVHSSTVQHTPSRMLATANKVDGAISLASSLMERIKWSAVSFSPGTISAKRSVLAVQSRITLSRACSLLKIINWIKQQFRMFNRIELTPWIHEYPCGSVRFALASYHP